MEAAVTVVALFVAVFLALRWLGRPHTAVRLAGGSAEVQRGTPPRGLVHDLADVARALPADAEGRVLLSGAGSRVHIDIEGLDEGPAQRVRNVVRMHQERIR